MKNPKTNSVHIYTKNNAVFIKDTLATNTWYPVNFQWKPVLELKHNME